MANKEYVTELAQGIDHWNKWRLNNPEIKPDLSGLNLSSHESISDLFGLGADYLMLLSGIDFSNVNFQGSVWNKIELQNARLNGADLSKSKLYSCRFENVIFSVKTATIRDNWDEQNNLSETFQSSYAQKACLFAGTKIYDTVFTKTALSYCDLSKAQFDESIQFIRSGVIGTKISRSQLETLNEDNGLSRRRIGQMDVIDDVAVLRQTFSGVWNNVHMIALLVFAAPYLWFLGQQWRLATSNTPLLPGTRTEPILCNLGRYIVSGGNNWREIELNNLAFGLFLIAILLNGLRIVLYVKTKLLEHQQHISGHFNDFKLTGMWKILFNWYKPISYLGLLLIAMHTIRFLMKPVPI